MRRLAAPRLAAFVLVFAALGTAPAAAEDVTVMTSGTFTAAYLELGPRFERATGHRLITATTSMGVGEESIPSRVARG
jgi:molybdate transport system substrate-binding protein